MRQGWQFEDVHDHALVQDVLMPNETTSTEIQSNPVITPTSGTMGLFSTFTIKVRLLMND